MEGPQEIHIAAPEAGTYVLLHLDPVASVTLLKDDQATSEAAEIATQTYAGMVCDVRICVSRLSLELR